MSREAIVSVLYTFWLVGTGYHICSYIQHVRHKTPDGLSRPRLHAFWDHP
jgi:hypothetical protein